MTDFHRFMEDYMNYCMGHGPQDAAAIMNALRPYTDYIIRSCGGTREPPLMGVFVLKRAPFPWPDASGFNR